MATHNIVKILINYNNHTYEGHTPLSKGLKKLINKNIIKVIIKLNDKTF